MFQGFRAEISNKFIFKSIKVNEKNIFAVKCQAGEFCVQCNLNNINDDDCGYVTESLNDPTLVTCDPALGCFTETFYSKNSLKL